MEMVDFMYKYYDDIRDLISNLRETYEIKQNSLFFTKEELTNFLRITWVIL